jgi:hypothetical protein
VCALQSDKEKMICEWFLSHDQLEGEKVRNSMKVFGISKKFPPFVIANSALKKWVDLE